MPRKNLVKNDAEASASLNTERLILWPLLLVLATALTWSYSQYYRANQELLQYKDPVKRQQLDLARNQALIAELKTKIELPAAEPGISVVVDAEKLRTEQPFFRDSQPGDYLFLYPDFAVLYRASTGQVVNSGRVEPVGTASGEVRSAIEVRNGSDKKGQAAELSDSLKQKGWLVLGVDNAATTSYQGNLIVAADQAKVGELAKELKATVTSSLPSGEASSSADIIIILGN